MDAASGIVLAECMAGKIKGELVLDTTKQAMKRWHLPKNAIFHSER
jgi:hypothetical protein